MQSLRLITPSVHVPGLLLVLNMGILRTSPLLARDVGWAAPDGPAFARGL